MCAAPTPGLKCQELLARAVAKTKGVRCAAALALTEFVKRSADGECVIMFPLRGKWLVGTEQEMQIEVDHASAVSKARVLSSRVETAAREARLAATVPLSPKRTR